MWKVLDTLGRRPLLAHFRAQAQVLQRHALLLVGDGAPGERDGDVAWARALLTTVSAGAVCCYVLRPALSPRRWRSVKQSLDRQRRLMGSLAAVTSGAVIPPRAAFRGIAGLVRGADERRLVAALVGRIGHGRVVGPAPPERRAIEETLREQSACANNANAQDDMLEPMLRGRIVRAYDKARNAARRDPAGGGSRRRLERLMWIEELMAARTGPIVRGRFPTTVAGRLWMGLQEDRWLRLLPGTEPARELTDGDSRRLARLLRRRRRQLARCNRALAVQTLGDTRREFADRLPWRVFLALAETPDALGPLPGNGG